MKSQERRTYRLPNWQAFALQAEGLIDRGGRFTETSQDLLQTKATVDGCKQVIAPAAFGSPSSSR